MSTFVDYEYRCEGDSKLVAEANAAIEALKSKYADFSGGGNFDFENEVEISDGGKSLSWTCYAIRGMQELDDPLTALTCTGQLKLTIYQGCTDGTNEGRLLEIVGGEVETDIDCDADIGMQAMLDIVALQEVADSKALGRLIVGLKAATRGWNPSFFKADEAVVVQEDDEEDEYDEEGDGDYSEILRAGVLAAMIGDTMDMYPAMLDLPAHSNALLNLAVKVNMTRHYMFKYKLASKPVQHGINALIAKVEKLTLSAAIAKPKAKTAVSTRQAVRL